MNLRLVLGNGKDENVMSTKNVPLVLKDKMEEKLF